MQQVRLAGADPAGEAQTGAGTPHAPRRTPLTPPTTVAVAAEELGRAVQHQPGAVSRGPVGAPASRRCCPRAPGRHRPRRRPPRCRRAHGRVRGISRTTSPVSDRRGGQVGGPLAPGDTRAEQPGVQHVVRAAVQRTQCHGPRRHGRAGRAQRRPPRRATADRASSQRSAPDWRRRPRDAVASRRCGPCGLVRVPPATEHSAPTGRCVGTDLRGSASRSGTPWRCRHDLCWQPRRPDRTELRHLNVRRFDMTWTTTASSTTRSGPALRTTAGAAGDLGPSDRTRCQLRPLDSYPGQRGERPLVTRFPADRLGNAADVPLVRRFGVGQLREHGRLDLGTRLRAGRRQRLAGVVTARLTGRRRRPPAHRPACSCTNRSDRETAKSFHARRLRNM